MFFFIRPNNFIAFCNNFIFFRRLAALALRARATKIRDLSRVADRDRVRYFGSSYIAQPWLSEQGKGCRENPRSPIWLCKNNRGAVRFTPFPKGRLVNSRAVGTLPLLGEPRLPSKRQTKFFQ